MKNHWIDMHIKKNVSFSFRIDGICSWISCHSIEKGAYYTADMFFIDWIDPHFDKWVSNWAVSTKEVNGFSASIEVYLNNVLKENHVLHDIVLQHVGNHMYLKGHPNYVPNLHRIIVGCSNVNQINSKYIGRG